MMATLLTFILDHSGSMNDPFQNRIELSGDIKRGDYANKLDAAKQSLFEQISALPPDYCIQVIAFTSQAEMLVPPTPVSNFYNYRQRIQDLRAEDGTDIANALNFFLTSYNRYGDFNVKRILLISDGLSDHNEAHRSALACKKIEVSIDMILIDPSPDGVETANLIATSLGGIVTPVGSNRDLSMAVHFAADFIDKQETITNDVQANVARRDKAGYLFTAILITVSVIAVAFLSLSRVSSDRPEPAANVNTDIPCAVNTDIISNSKQQETDAVSYQNQYQSLLFLGGTLGIIILSVSIYFLYQSRRTKKTAYIPYKTLSGEQKKDVEIPLRNKKQQLQLRYLGSAVFVVGVGILVTIEIMIRTGDKTPIATITSQTAISSHAAYITETITLTPLAELLKPCTVLPTTTSSPSRTFETLTTPIFPARQPTSKKLEM